MLKVILVVGARPNFMKAAPLYEALSNTSILKPIILHTGQHYDYTMSQVFFEQLNLPKPDYFLNIRSGTHAQQEAKILVKFEKVLTYEKPDLIVVFGDVNSTFACALVARKMFIPVAHVEAGLRSYDETMPEEINRRLTDSLSEFLFTPSVDANENLLKEGISKAKIYLVGNIMIDSLTKSLEKLSDQEDDILKKQDLDKKNYGLITLHRPNNVDSQEKLDSILKEITKISKLIPILFPVHPRTAKMVEQLKFKTNKQLKLVLPLGYNDFIVLEKNAAFVLTDSGGIQEETTFLNVPCLTLRPNTERPITITIGTNKLVTDSDLLANVKIILGNGWKKGDIPILWDGKTAERIAGIILLRLLKTGVKKD